MDDDTGLEARVTLWRGEGESIHSHTTLASVRRRCEVGIVDAGTILGVKDDIVSAYSAPTEVGCLEVASCLCETKDVQDVAELVRGVEKLDGGGIDVFSWLPALIELGSEVKIAREWAWLVDEVCVAVRVGLSDGVVATGFEKLILSVGVPAKL